MTAKSVAAIGMCIVQTLLLDAWAGTVIVDYQVEAEVFGRDDGGHEWQAPKEAVSTLPRDPKALAPFSAVQYRSPVLQWTFGTGTLGFGGTIINKSSAELCLRFDMARVSSNLHSDDVPLLVYHDLRRGRPSGRPGDKGKFVNRGTTAPGPRAEFVPKPLCLASGEEIWLSMGPSLATIFPTLNMFNVRLENGELVEAGVGNWIKLTLPVEYASKQESLTVKLTALDSKARVSNY